MHNPTKLLANESLILFKALSNYAQVNTNGTSNHAIDCISDNSPKSHLPEILFITSYPPRECGIATYSHDLLHAWQQQFNQSFSVKVCALENGEATGAYVYPNEVKYILHTDNLKQYYHLADSINNDENLQIIMVQHEFGLYGGVNGEYLVRFLSSINKPIISTFHTVLPRPNEAQKKIIQNIITLSAKIIVMTQNAATILAATYGAPDNKITIIAHGTHLTAMGNKQEKKAKKHLGNRTVLSTFGLLSSGKCIETALDALPAIVAEFPEVVYLIIGKTHPNVIKREGENYRNLLFEKVIALELQNNVRFINKYLVLSELQEYLQLTDIYLFTSKNPDQAVSGTFAYAMAGGCPVISTPIPHATEMLNEAGVIIDFQNIRQLAAATIQLLSNPALLQQMRLNALHKMRPTAWQNAAIAHCQLVLSVVSKPTPATLKYAFPPISLQHVKRLTTNMGMIQFANISLPDLQSGYTLDDNARALIAVTRHFAMTGEQTDLYLMEAYLNLILHCQQPLGNFYNYVDADGHFFEKNDHENLEDANGRAIWALGELIAQHHALNELFTQRAHNSIQLSLCYIATMKSPRAVAFALKGLYHRNMVQPSEILRKTIVQFADNLVSKYNSVSDAGWQWYEEYLTYGNSVLPEAVLYAYLTTGNPMYLSISKQSFNFLLSIIFQNGHIRVVSNQGWHIKGQPTSQFGEQPIDVAYTILALGLFYDTFHEPHYLLKMEQAFSWFLGKNHLQQIMYNPSSGGCYDGLEEKHINLNQGAESTVSYLLARLMVEKYALAIHQQTTVNNLFANA